jgi:hypothetical protein
VGRHPSIVVGHLVVNGATVFLLYYSKELILGLRRWVSTTVALPFPAFWSYFAVCCAGDPREAMRVPTAREENRKER